MIIKQTRRLAKKVSTKQVQKYRDTEVDSPEPSCRRVFAIPFIDKLISELELRFTKLSCPLVRLLFLIPRIIQQYPDI